jgi:hypothetical protein
MLPGWAGAQSASVSGFVADSSNGESLIEANIYIEDLQTGTATNSDGYYVIHPIPPGEHDLVCSYIGYKLFRQKINLAPGEKLFLNIILSPQAITSEAVNVIAEAATVERDIKISQVSLSARAIQQGPKLGEADLFRTLQALPGVVAESDFSTGLVVRGGNTDQNLVMLDGITVYNPSHMGGLFSNFLLDAVKDANFIKGGYPAEYGGRMSSVLNVISREGNKKEFSGSFSVSVLSSHLSIETPVGNGALLLAGRRTYFDQALKLFNEEFPYYFYDFQGSFHQDLTPYDRLTISGYFGNDVLDWDKISINLRWGNRTLAANWRHVFSPRLFSNFMIAGSRFITRVEFGGDEGIDSENTILDYTLKGDLTYFFSPKNDIKFGFEAKKLLFQYESIYDNRTLLRIKQTPIEAAAYLQNNRQLGQRWLMNLGLRTSYFSSSEENIFLEPRLSFKYKLGNKEYLNFSSGIFRQFMFTVQDEYNPNITNDWFAVDETVPAGSSVHFILGYEKELWSTTRIQIEGFYKTLDNMLTYRETRAAVDESLGENILINDLFVPTDGYSYGGEIFLHKKFGQLSGWIGYTLSWVRKKLDADRYYASFDRRHNLNILLNYELGKNWRFGTRFNYGSGFPYTRALASYEERDAGQVERRIIYDSKRNRFRYPTYIRWDLGFTKAFKMFGLSSELDIQLVNAMNRDNVFFYEWDFNENPAKRNDVTMLPIIPTIGIKVNF